VTRAASGPWRAGAQRRPRTPPAGHGSHDPRPELTAPSATALTTSRPFEAHQARPRPRGAGTAPVQETGDAHRVGKVSGQAPPFSTLQRLRMRTLCAIADARCAFQCTSRPFSGNPRRISTDVRRCADETPVFMMIGFVIWPARGQSSGGAAPAPERQNPCRSTRHLLPGKSTWEDRQRYTLRRLRGARPAINECLTDAKAGCRLCHQG
jgi:hypothetical protein